MTTNNPPINHRKTSGHWAIFATGFFSLSQIPMLTLIVPLWALEIGASAFWIGMAISMRALLSLFFSIQIGAVMDRVGTRKVTLCLALCGSITVLLYPLFPSITGILILQVVVGFLHVATWIGAQALVGRLTRGEPQMMGRFTFLATLGNFLGPTLAGAAFDHFGPWGAFGIVSLWSLVLVMITMGVPKFMDHGSKSRVSIIDMLPRWTQYTEGFGLLRVPLIAYVIVISALLAGTYAMRHTFFAVYMAEINFTKTEIGFIIGCIALSGSVAGLFVGTLSRWLQPSWLVLFATALSTISFCMAPLFSGFWSLLIVACATGTFSGTAFPMILSVLTRGVETKHQGLSVGLRATTNRIASLTVPVVMGAIVAKYTLATGFFTMGTIILLIVFVMGIVLTKILRHQHNQQELNP